MKALAVVAAIILLSACGGSGGSDSDQINTNSQPENQQPQSEQPTNVFDSITGLWGYCAQASNGESTQFALQFADNASYQHTINFFGSSDCSGAPSLSVVQNAGTFSLATSFTDQSGVIARQINFVNNVFFDLPLEKSTNGFSSVYRSDNLLYLSRGRTTQEIMSTDPGSRFSNINFSEPYSPIGFIPAPEQTVSPDDPNVLNVQGVVFTVQEFGFTSFSKPSVTLLVENARNSGSIYNTSCDVFAISNGVIIDTASLFFADLNTIRVGDRAIDDGAFFDLDSHSDYDSTRMECSYLLR